MSHRESCWNCEKLKSPCNLILWLTFSTTLSASIWSFGSRLHFIFQYGRYELKRTTRLQQAFTYQELSYGNDVQALLKYKIWIKAAYVRVSRVSKPYWIRCQSIYCRRIQINSTRKDANWHEKEGRETHDWEEWTNLHIQIENRNVPRKTAPHLSIKVNT